MEELENPDHHRARVILALVCCILFGPPGLPVIAQQPTATARDETVTPVDVKRFLDPTILTSGIRYDFGYVDQSDGAVYAHTFSLDLSLSPQHVLFADIPVMRATVAGATEAGIGDVSVGYVFVPFENLERRFTTVAFRVEAAIPAGDADRGLGLGTWVLSPGVGVALNVTDLLPIYAIYTYRHSVGDVGPSPETSGADAASDRLRVSDVDISTVRILPRGFWVLAALNWVVNPSVSEAFLAVGGGRAINRKFAWSLNYEEHLSGRQSFARRVSVSLDYLLPW